MASSNETTTRDMVLLLTGYLSYRALRGRRDDLKLPLKPDEERRLGELERVFGAPSAGTESRPSFLLRLEERAELRLPIEFRGPDGEPAEGHMCNLSASGFFVETGRPAARGERLAFKFLDLAAGRAWQFVGQVEWTRQPAAQGTAGGMGLRFVGIPLEVRLGANGERPFTVAA